MTAKDFKHKVITLSDRLFPMVARMLGNDENAADAMQEIMLKLWNKRHQLVKHPSINGFVFLTARNYCLDLLRKSRPSTIEIEKSIVSVTQEELEWKELKMIVEKLLKQLPEQQREIMLMRDIDGLSFEEITATTGLKVEHIRVLLSRARKKIASQLKTNYSYEK